MSVWTKEYPKNVHGQKYIQKISVLKNEWTKKCPENVRKPDPITIGQKK